MITFFTDIQTNASNYCLLNIKSYNDLRKLDKKLVYIDPSVMELKKQSEFNNIEQLHELASGKTAENEFISIDYPCDMNVAYSELFIEKSIQNNLRYKDNSHYICTIQFRFHDFIDFVKQFEYLEEQIDFSQKIIGIGNLCRILYPDLFTHRVFAYLRQKSNKYHFYGLAMRLIRMYLPTFFDCSVDSTKWTRPITDSLKKMLGVNPNDPKVRNIFFLSYMREISKFVQVRY